jgi:hypothetical protein
MGITPVSLGRQNGMRPPECVLDDTGNEAAAFLISMALLAQRKWVPPKRLARDDEF